MAANTAKISVGRLLEIRADGGYRTAVEVDRLFGEIEDALRSQNSSGSGHVAVVDWRRCPLMSPEAATRIAQRIAGMNARTLRSAAIARQDAPLAVLQFVRVIRETAHPERKLFFAEAELETWLAEVLTPVEQQRLHAFLTHDRAVPHK